MTAGGFGSYLLAADSKLVVAPGAASDVNPTGQSFHIFDLATTRGKCMWDACAVDLRLTLPRVLAAEVEEVQRRDPEMLSRLMAYMLARRAIYEHLAQTSVAARES